MDGAALSVEELAAAAHLTVRTVRYYQAEGLLPAPERVGRTARYGAAHVERLELITSLQERGLRLAAIRDVLARSAPGAPADWLGLDDAMKRPWSDDRPTILDGDALAGMLEGLPDGTRTELEAAGLVERRDDTRPPVWFVPSPGMLEVGLDSLRLGLSVDEGTRLRKLLQQRLGDLADDLVAQFTDDVGLRRLSDAGPAALAELLHVVQPLARRTVEILFAHEMERAQRDLLAKEYRDD